MSIQGQTRVFGRGTDHAKDPFPRLHLVRYRPIETQVAAVLDNQHISRIQLLLRPLDAKRLHVENVGLCELFHNGQLAQAAEVRSGDILRLGKQLSFVATRRSLGAFSPRQGYDAFDFGTADSAGIVGESIAIWKLRMDLAFVASRTGHVLIHGPSGTGKELVAQAIHRLSPSVERPLVSRSAATIPEALIDAELFGNARNYPNPGMSDRPGLIGEANNSTLFLDEFAELPPEAQAHLLRVLDHGEYQRLGETTRRQSAFRLVAATNRPLSAIKEDVLARFSFRIHTSPLNDRREDIPLLLRHLLRKLVSTECVKGDGIAASGDSPGNRQVSQELVEALVRHDYTTGYRELQSLALQALASGRYIAEQAASPSETLKAAGPSASTTPPADPSQAPADASDRPFDPSRPEDIQACLYQHNGVLEKAWRALGLKNRHLLVRLIAKHRLEVRRKPSVRPRAPRGK